MAPTSIRSSSISSASTSSSKSSKSSSDGIKKKFGCGFPGCGKSFSRSEHLHRHALNHKDGNNTCLRCMAHFRRRDLLDRHMARHKEKDDEAGGEGLGILATRKRLWRDADGKIVNARRPSYTQEGVKRRQIGGSERKSSTASDASTSSQSSHSLISSPHILMSRTGSSASSTIIVDTGSPDSPDQAVKSEDQLKQDSWLEMAALPTSPSPPISFSERSNSDPSDEDAASELDALYEDTWPVIHNGLPEIINDSPVLGRQSEYPASPSWGPQPFQTFMGAVAELPYDDIFKPEIGGMYEWNSQVLMSRCREEKFDGFEERKRDWCSPYGEGRFGRTYGLGAA